MPAEVWIDFAQSCLRAKGWLQHNLGRVFSQCFPLRIDIPLQVCSAASVQLTHSCPAFAHCRQLAAPLSPADRPFLGYRPEDRPPNEAGGSCIAYWLSHPAHIKLASGNRKSVVSYNYALCIEAECVSIIVVVCWKRYASVIVELVFRLLLLLLFASCRECARMSH